MSIIESNDFGYVEQKRLNNWAARYAEALDKKSEANFCSHKGNAVLDHPDGCVTREKLSPGLIGELEGMQEDFEAQLETVYEKFETKADVENTAGGFSGGKEAVCKNGAQEIDAVQLGKGTNSSAKTLQVYHYRLMDADGTIPEARIPQLGQKADRKTIEGGFLAGEAKPFEGGGACIGRNASNTAGVAIGEGSSNENGAALGNYSSVEGSGGAVGYSAAANNGGAAGYNAAANNGGAVGGMAKAGEGFSGGYYATVGKNIHGGYVDAIQLGRGSNQKEKTLQVYGYCMMDADGTLPMARLPQLQNRFASKIDGGFMTVPSVNSKDIIVELKNSLISVQHLSIDGNGGYVYQITGQLSYEFYLEGEKKTGMLQLRTQHTLNPDYGQDQTFAHLTFHYETNSCSVVWYNSAEKPAHGVCSKTAKTISDLYWFELGWDGQYQNVLAAVSVTNEDGIIAPLALQDTVDALEERIYILEQKIEELKA